MPLCVLMILAEMWMVFVFGLMPTRVGLIPVILEGTIAVKFIGGGGGYIIICGTGTCLGSCWFIHCAWGCAAPD